jgi:hypothetical protein
VNIGLVTPLVDVRGLSHISLFAREMLAVLLGFARVVSTGGSQNASQLNGLTRQGQYHPVFWYFRQEECEK